LPNTKSAIKQLRVSEKKRLRNRRIRSRARTFVKKTNRLIEAGDLEQAKEMARQEAIIALDKAAQKGVIHKNTAARYKSRLMKRLHKAQAVME